jgi:hypothetical protein
MAANQTNDYRLECAVVSERPLETIELVVNGVVTQRFAPENTKTAGGSFESQISAQFTPKTSSWLAWRCFEKRTGNRIRFAHTAPWHFGIPGKPLRPRRVETEWLVANVEAEIARSEGIAPESLISEYRRALEIYKEINSNAE